MAGAGRQDDDVARHDVDLFTLFAAETHRGAPARNRHRLVDGRMIMRIDINTVVPPHIAPAVRREGLFDQLFGVGCPGEIDAAAIKHERQLRIVRNPAVIGEFMGDGIG